MLYLSSSCRHSGHVDNLNMQIEYGVYAVIFNILFLLTMFLVEKFYSKTQRIPKRRKFDREKLRENFLYTLDFYSVFLGDLVGLSFIDFGMGMIFIENTPSIYVITGAGILSVFVAMILNRDWMGPTHQPSSSYPEAGKISFIGVLHLIYLFIQIGVAAVACYVLIAGTGFSLPKMAILAGAVIYGIAFMADLFSGRYKHLKFA